MVPVVPSWRFQVARTGLPGLMVPSSALFALLSVVVLSETFSNSTASILVVSKALAPHAAAWLKSSSSPSDRMTFQAWPLGPPAAMKSVS